MIQNSLNRLSFSGLLVSRRRPPPRHAAARTAGDNPRRARPRRGRRRTTRDNPAWDRARVSTRVSGRVSRGHPERASGANGFGPLQRQGFLPRGRPPTLIRSEAARSAGGTRPWRYPVGKSVPCGTRKDTNTPLNRRGPGRSRPPLRVIHATRLTREQARRLV